VVAGGWLTMIVSSSMKEKHPGDPSPLSPSELWEHEGYQHVHEEQYLSTSRRSSGRIETTFLHKETNTYWRTGYEVRLDDSDAGQSAHWQQVKPREVVTVVYDPI
jgi:hypothetical protein